MSVQEIDAYISAQSEPARSMLEHLRAQILSVVPEAQQCISYGMPGFKLDGVVVAGFAAFKNHIGYFPHSGRVIPELAADLEGYTISGKSGGVHFPLDMPVPDDLVEKLIQLRIAQATKS